ncbi:MAG: hypothetical protein ACM3ML_05030 [Micromonosporaceae bacterium]
MSLPVSQRRILHGIEQQLCSSDRRLTSLFGVFTWLTQDEDVPHQEQLTPRRVRRIPRPVGRTPRRIARGAWLRTAVFCAIAITALTCAVAIGAARHATQRCGPTPPPHTSAHTSAQARAAAGCTPAPGQNPAP